MVIWAKSGLGKPGKVSIYACDGVGPPQGMAVWFGGTVDRKAVEAKPAQLASSGEREQLTIDTYNERLAKGTFTTARGDTHQYIAYPARDGAGIYEVTLDRNLKYTGTSTLGDKVTAQAERNGDVAGNLTTADGEKIDFNLHTLSLYLSGRPRPQRSDQDLPQGRRAKLVPGDYVAVIAPSSTHWLGRIKRSSVVQHR